MLFIDKKNKFKILQNINESQLQDFIEFFEYATYKMSWIINYNKNPVGGNHHTHGGVVELLRKIKIPHNIYKEWIYETEHGFLHGFCTLYFSFCLSTNKNLLWKDLHWYNRKVDEGKPRFTNTDNLIVSYIVHDIMRFAKEGYKDHDKNLNNISNLFLPEVYSHSNPCKDSLLIHSDRLELLRYSDDSWIDYTKLNFAIKKYGGIDLIKHFFKHIRPLLEKMFAGRNEMWFSHALEVREHPIWNHVDKEKKPSDIKDNLNSYYYPKFHWTPIDPGYVEHFKPEYEKYFSVHSGRLPFDNCIAHTKGYYRAQAIINHSTIKKYGCDIECAPPSTAGRDHLFIVQNKKIPTKEWCFLYEFGTNHDNQFDQIELDDLTTIKSSLFNNIYRASQLFLNNMECLSIT